MTMNAWAIEQLGRDHASQLQRESATHRIALAGQFPHKARRRGGHGGRRHLPARWTGRLLIRAGARLAGTPVFVAADRPAKAV